MISEFKSKVSKYKTQIKTGFLKKNMPSLFLMSPSLHSFQPFIPQLGHPFWEVLIGPANWAGSVICPMGAATPQWKIVFPLLAQHLSPFMCRKFPVKWASFRTMVHCLPQKRRRADTASWYHTLTTWVSSRIVVLFSPRL